MSSGSIVAALTRRRSNVPVCKAGVTASRLFTEANFFTMKSYSMSTDPMAYRENSLVSTWRTLYCCNSSATFLDSLYRLIIISFACGLLYKDKQTFYSGQGRECQNARLPLSGRIFFPIRLNPIDRLCVYLFKGQIQ